MEYVGGEDLASLLRRIGRFPQEKAIEVARQICAGVAAAHERGVLHRDLKPANVMIDGEGRVRLTDFGLAAIAGSVDNIRAGTPAYMAPEQLAGREVTARSDIYALGLVLFELFTGKRVFEAATLNELIQLHESGPVATPSSLVRDLDPTIERAIQRCLEREPAKRPSSALAVSAALPGGDQLAAALAAGETPSPEMVAAAGEQSALQPGIGLALVAFTAVMLAILTVVSQRFGVIDRIPLPKSTDALRDRAQEMLERLGYPETPYDSVHGWMFRRDYVDWAAGEGGADPRALLPGGRTGTVNFWYRTSPVPIVSAIVNPLPTTTDPPFVAAGMRMVYLDPNARLVEFQALSPQVDDGAAAPAPDWTPLFDFAGLSRSAFHDVTPLWLPRNHADVRAAWEGPFPDMPGMTLRVEAAAYHGKPVFFNVVAPWTRATRNMAPRAASIGTMVGTIANVIGVLIMIASAFLARRHLRDHRLPDSAIDVSKFEVLDTSSFASDPAAATLVKRLHQQAKSVVNFGLGYERKVSDRFSFYGALTTDRTFADKNDSAGNSLSTWDIYHGTAGVSLVVKSMKLTMGGAYSFGSDARSIPTLIVPPGGAPVLISAPLDVKYSRLRVLVGFDFGR
jgi:serine/threonine-protein kinase